MKPFPLLLLLSSALLFSHLRPAAGRPRSLPGWLDDSSSSSRSSLLDLVPQQQQPLDQRLLGAAGMELLGENMMRALQRRTQEPLRLLPTPEEEEEEEEEDEEEAVRAAAARLLLLKRSEEPPLSIDLTFHLLRNMIQMAKVESQRERALLNRKVLDEVGK